MDPSHHHASSKRMKTADDKEIQTVINYDAHHQKVDAPEGLPLSTYT